MIHQSSIGYLLVFLFAFDSAFCAKYRTKKAPNNTEIRGPASNPAEHTDTTPLLSSVVGTIDTSRANKEEVKEPFQLIKSGQPGFYGRKNMAYRKAKVIFNSGNGYTAAESLKIAHQQVTEKRRSDSKRKREILRAKGLKPKQKYRPGHNNKDDVIGRKITQLLAADNNIVKHEDAKKEAIKWYKEQGRKRGATFRAKKKQELAQQATSDSPNKSSL